MFLFCTVSTPSFPSSFIINRDLHERKYLRLSLITEKSDLSLSQYQLLSLLTHYLRYSVLNNSKIVHFFKVLTITNEKQNLDKT